MNRKSRNRSNWYGVKLLHKFLISGMPVQNRIDEHFHDSKVFFEESVLLVKASSFDEAYEIAEKSARDYNDIYTNKYGQTVKQEFYKSIDCFILYGSPKNCVEVYSNYFLEKQNDDEEFLIDKRYENCTVEELHLLRHL